MNSRELTKEEVEIEKRKEIIENMLEGLEGFSREQRRLFFQNLRKITFVEIAHYVGVLIVSEELPQNELLEKILDYMDVRYSPFYFSFEGEISMKSIKSGGITYEIRIGDKIVLKAGKNIEETTNRQTAFNSAKATLLKCFNTELQILEDIRKNKKEE